MKKEFEGKLEEVERTSLDWKTKYENTHIQLSQSSQQHETLEKEILQLRTELNNAQNMLEASKENQKIMDTNLKSELQTWQQKYHSLETDYQDLQLEYHKILNRCSELEATAKSNETEIQNLRHDLPGKEKKIIFHNSLSFTILMNMLFCGFYQKWSI